MIVGQVWSHHVLTPHRSWTHLRSRSHPQTPPTSDVSVTESKPVIGHVADPHTTIRSPGRQLISIGVITVTGGAGAGGALGHLILLHHSSIATVELSQT